MYVNVPAAELVALLIAGGDEKRCRNDILDANTSCWAGMRAGVSGKRHGSSRGQVRRTPPTVRAGEADQKLDILGEKGHHDGWANGNEREEVAVKGGREGLAFPCQQLLQVVAQRDGNDGKVGAALHGDNWGKKGRVNTKQGIEGATVYKTTNLKVKTGKSAKKYEMNDTLNF